jgi:hypothetical protein
MKKVCVFLAAALLALGVCAPASADTEILVQRADSPTNSGFKERVYIDGKERLSLANGASGKITVPNGEHTIHASLYTLTTQKMTFNAGGSSLIFVITPYSSKELAIENKSGGAQSAAANPAASLGAAAQSANAAQRAATAQNDNSVEGSLARAADQIMTKIPQKSKLAIVYVTASDPDVAEFIAGELEFIMVDQGFILVDRSQLDQIRKEKALQLSGEIDDAQAASIGKESGANIIITGAVTGTGDFRRLRLRALGTESAQVVAVASEKF